MTDKGDGLYGRGLWVCEYTELGSGRSPVMGNVKSHSGRDLWGIFSRRKEVYKVYGEGQNKRTYGDCKTY